MAKKKNTKTDNVSPKKTPNAENKPHVKKELDKKTDEAEEKPKKKNILEKAFDTVKETFIPKDSKVIESKAWDSEGNEVEPPKKFSDDSWGKVHTVKSKTKEIPLIKVYDKKSQRNRMLTQDEIDSEPDRYRIRIYRK